MAAPVRHTCPDIDKAIDKIKSVYRIIKYASKLEEVTELKDTIDEIESELWNFDDILEDLRSDNSKLRDWGHELEGRVEDLETELLKTNNE